MMTQTHTLVSVAALSRRSMRPGQYWAIAIGSFVPDAVIYGLFVWSKFAGIPEHTLWRETYFAEPMPTLTAIGNSVPLYASILLISLALFRSEAAETKSRTALTSIGALFSLAAILHLAGDFPVHVDDAHPHFWPLTGWRFHSPVSYWDPKHYGNLFRWFEVALATSCALIIFRRFKARWVRALCVFAMIAYVAVPIYFSITMDHS